MKIRFFLGLLWVVTGLALVACGGQGAVETTGPTAEAQLPAATEAAANRQAVRWSSTPVAAKACTAHHRPVCGRDGHRCPGALRQHGRDGWCLT